jgi:CelD/BcsL family acetyltransferase involved in cellulose biosynthesis
LSAGFQAYLASLGGSSRRTLYNLRRRLQEHGPVRLDMVAPQDALQALSELDALHVSRWRQPVFSDGSLPLHRDLIERWSSHGRIVLSRLMVGSRCVSCLYDIRIGTRQYNIQMGFDSQFDAKISLGILHLGYAMEDAAAKGVHTYDLLCGRGMRSDYKRNISNASTPLQTVHALRRGGVSLLYRLHDATSEFGLRRVRRLPA